VRLALSCAQALSSAADGEDPIALEEALKGWEGFVAPGARRRASSWMQCVPCRPHLKPITLPGPARGLNVHLFAPCSPAHWPRL
jgi:hypothetical protein